MDGNRTDMSGTCEFKYDEYWMAANHYHTMSQEDWMKWYNEHCGKCIYMCEICMHGEE
jgi:hypothetical protein